MARGDIREPQAPELNAELKSVRRTNGGQASELANGNTIEYASRGRGSARERLGWWDSRAVHYDVAIDGAKWDACAVDEPPTSGKTSLGVKFAAEVLPAHAGMILGLQ